MNLRNHLLAALAAGLFALAGPASADVIITYGQSGSGNTITGTASATGTVWGGTDIPITVTQIAPNGPATPFNAFLDVSAHSIGGANTVGPFITQEFAGTFSICSTAAGCAVNYLSGSFSDGALTASGAVQIVVAAPDVTFTSSVILALGAPDALGFSFTNVAPPVTLAACTNTNPGCNTGQTIASFTASVSGNASATEVPEPATIAMFGMGLLGFGLMRRRRKLAA